MVNQEAPALDAAFAALADPTRRAIVERLSRGSLSVSDLAAPFAVSAPAISRHLRVLERAGLVRRHVLGRVHQMHLAPEPLETVEAWLDVHRRFWEQQLDALSHWLESDSPDEETARWRSPKPGPTRRSGSNASSRRRPSASSRRGPRPKR